MIGVFWGAFDPLTAAHIAIIKRALEELPIKKLLIIVNDHSYKDYLYPLSERIEAIKKMLERETIPKCEVLAQNDADKLDFSGLKKRFQSELCAIAGYDSYQKWQDMSSLQGRSQYAMIAVVPRGDLPEDLRDPNARLLRIDTKYKYTSSSNFK